LQEKIIFYNRETNCNLELKAKIYFSLKNSLFNLNSFEFKFEIVLRQHRRLNNKSIFVDNRVNKSILRYSIENRVDKIEFANIRSSQLSQSTSYNLEKNFSRNINLNFREILI